jgi:hypothetical protein
MARPTKAAGRRGAKKTGPKRGANASRGKVNPRRSALVKMAAGRRRKATKAKPVTTSPVTAPPVMT